MDLPTKGGSLCLHEHFREEWIQNVIKWIMNSTETININVHGKRVLECIQIKLIGDYFRHPMMTLFYYNSHSACFSHSTSYGENQMECMLFADFVYFSQKNEYRNIQSCRGACKYFEERRNTYITCNTFNSLLLTIYDFYENLQEPHLQPIEMILRDSYVMQHIAKN